MSQSLTTVTKRDRRIQPFNVQKLTWRVRQACEGLSVPSSAQESLVQEVIQSVDGNVQSDEIDSLLASCANQHGLSNPTMASLAARVELSRIYKRTPKSFFTTMLMAEASGLLDGTFMKTVVGYGDKLDEFILHAKDTAFTYVALKNLQASYLLTAEGFLERPQHMFMRISVALHGDDLPAVINSYEQLSSLLIVHATPTISNAGCLHNQLSSCYVLPVIPNVHGMFTNLLDCALISEGGGGLGLSLTNIPAASLQAKHTIHKGIVPAARLFDAANALVDQSQGRRRGAMAVYLEPWHRDIVPFINLRRPGGSGLDRTHNLFNALWTPDLFMKRVQANADWSLFCPTVASHLTQLHGDEFEDAYHQLEASAVPRMTLKASVLWHLILTTQRETGGPFILFKDSINRKNNQRHLGTITHSNLCTEIMLFSSHDETAVCHIASINLPQHCKDGRLDFDSIEASVRCLVRNLNQVIDRTSYPTPASRKSSKAHRAIAIGLQGLADAFTNLGIAFDSPEARHLNKQVAECLYYTAILASCDLKDEFGVYESFHGSPISQGILQCDLWNVTPSSRYDWDHLRSKVKNGLANSTLIAYMPTAGTTLFTSSSEGISPRTSNILVRRAGKGDFIIVAPGLQQRLHELGLWDSSMESAISRERGSIQNINRIPEGIRRLYKTAWDIEPETLVDMSSDRAPYTCQSQSFSLFLEDTTNERLDNLLFYAWEKGLKTGMYYLHTRSPVQPRPFKTLLPLNSPDSPNPRQRCNLTPTSIPIQSMQ